MRTGLAMIVVAILFGFSFLVPAAQAESGEIRGDVPRAGGVGLVIWGGGTVDALAASAAVEGCALRSVFVTADGGFVGHAIGAPAFVNARFADRVGVVIAEDTPLLIVCAVATGAPPGDDVAGFRIDFIDVGQGDATLVTVNGERLLVDGGRSQARIEERLNTLGVTHIDAILSTHPDADHIAGLIRVLQLYTVERIYLNGGTSSSQTYANYLALVEASGAEVAVLTRGDTIPLGGLELDVLHPAGLTGDSNGNSLVVLLSCGVVDVILTGDATIASEQSMLAAGVVTPVDVLKVGHHGSSTSTGQPFLDALQPAYAVISAGMSNQFGHPHAEVVARLVAMDVEIYHTDLTADDDTVTMTSGCSTVTFEADPVPYGIDGTLSFRSTWAGVPQLMAA